MLRDECEDLVDSKHVGKSRMLRRDAKAAAYANVLRRTIEHRYCARIASADAEGDLERRRFPGAVGTEQRDDLPTLQAKGKTFERADRAIRFDDVFKRENHDVAVKSDCSSATWLANASRPRFVSRYRLSGRRLAKLFSSST